MGMEPIATLSLFALDTRDPAGLARFYSAILGWSIAGDQEDWIELIAPTGATLAFQRADDHVPPHWPGGERPQQAHLDFDVPDLDEAEERVLALGARKAEFQPGGDSWRVYLDPAGHPFCLVRIKAD